MRFLTFVCICDRYGYIQKILIKNYPDLCITPPARFLSIFDSQNHDKAELFFLGLVTGDMTHEVELILDTGLKPVLVFVKGFSIGEDILIIAESDVDDLIDYISEMMRINNTLVNTIREVFKSRSRLIVDNQSTGTDFLEELSKVNNELITFQRDLSKKNAELAKLNELKNRYVGIAAHDLRNPLSIISGYSHYLIDELRPKVTEEILEFMQIINSTSNNMLKMVEDILDLTALQSGTVKLNLSRVDILPYWDNILRLYRVLSKNKNIEISHRFDFQVPTINIDAIKIQQVISNLIGNAIKYSPPDTQIFIQASSSDASFEFSIRDQGLGIPDKDLQIIFEAFQRSSLARDPSIQSTGLGLSISKSIVKAHRGEIWAISEIGKGSTFFVKIPISFS